MHTEHEDMGKDPLIYELGFHLVPSLGEDAVALRVEELRNKLKELGATILHEGHPEEKALAYPMRVSISGKYHTFTNAYFGWVKFEMLPEGTHALKEACDANQDIVRYILVKTNSEAFTPTEVPREEGVREPIEAKGVGAQGAGSTEAVSDADIDKAVEDLASEEK